MFDERTMRRSQIIYPFGVGAIVDLPDESVMPLSIDYWGKSGEPVYDERLQRRLNLDYFRLPPSQDEDPRGVPVIRFPRWLFCPKCRRLRPVNEWLDDYQAVKRKMWDTPRCDRCGIKLVPSRFVVACENGHIDDFPWIEWVHGPGKSCGEPRLRITTGGTTSGLAGIRITCENCGESNNMGAAFTRNIMERFGKCSGYKPWSSTPSKPVHERCDKVPRTLQRGGSNVYFPRVASSILIPPYSDSIRRVIEDNDFVKALKRQTVDPGTQNYALLVSMALQTIQETTGLPAQVVKQALDSILSPTHSVEQSEVEYRHEEYLAFTGSLKGSADSKDFQVELRSGEDYNIPACRAVTLVHRLRELRALLGFSRIHPLDRNVFLPEEEGDTSVKFRSVRDSSLERWAPASEVRGEGIFLDFDREALEAWEGTPAVQERVGMIQRALDQVTEERGFTPRSITARFLLLHTVAHILIRQLSFDCGYSSAALRERIYCDNGSGDPMNAILIYTASSDSEGALGGLVRQGIPDLLTATFAKGVNKASWCSSDPLCIESSGQGLDNVNLAACHACVLVPETSCEEMNRFLDRALVVGTLDDPSVGFFRGLVE